MVGMNLRPGNAGSNTVTDHIGVTRRALAQVPGINPSRGQLADLEFRHRRRARCEDRIRDAKDTGLRNLPLKSLNQNRIWCLLVGIASELTAWMGMLAHPEHAARRWEPKRLRHRLFALPAAIARTGRRVWLRFTNRSRWTQVLINAATRLRALPAPAS